MRCWAAGPRRAHGRCCHAGKDLPTSHDMRFDAARPHTSGSGSLELVKCLLGFTGGESISTGGSGITSPGYLQETRSGLSSCIMTMRRHRERLTPRVEITSTAVLFSSGCVDHGGYAVGSDHRRTFKNHGPWLQGTASALVMIRATCYVSQKTFTDSFEEADFEIVHNEEHNVETVLRPSRR